MRYNRLYRNLKIIFLVILLVTLGIFVNNKYTKNNIVEANSVTEVFNLIGNNNPINKALKQQLKEIEQLKQEILLAERLAELEERQEAERLARIQLEILAKEEAEKLEKEKIEAERAEQKKKNINKKIAYLTFDDGPSPISTPAILDILGEYNIKATFFVVGKMVVNYPDVLLRTREEGHAIGNHTYSHNYDYLYASTTNFLADLRKNEQALKGVLGTDFETKVIRFPGGSFGKKKAQMKKIVQDEGYNYYDWNALNGDAEGILMPKEYLIRRLKETYKDEKDLIVLMHDTDPKTTTIESLRDIIDFLIGEGYEFSVIDENYGR